LSIVTDLGAFIAGYSERGLAELRFPSDRRAAALKSGATASTRIQQWHRVTGAAVKATLAGCTPESFPPLDLSVGTAFQQSVWRAMIRIPLGRTNSYGELADAIGQPKAVRAVGGACGANPIPVLVPCHRVLAAHHQLGGFSSGLGWKRELLTREGVNLL